MRTVTDKVRDHFRRFPNADVLKAAHRFNTAPARIYKLRKEIHEELANAARKQESTEGDQSINEVVTWTATSEGDNIVATLTERGTRYGKFKDHADVTQKLKFIIRQHMGANYDRMEPDQIESIEMICHKLGRIANGDPNYADSWIDIAGYAKLVSDRLEGVER